MNYFFSEKIMIVNWVFIEILEIKDKKLDLKINFIVNYN